MSPPRAAADFPLIRARMEELRRERTRPRAADDFRAIRLRMEETSARTCSAIGPKEGTVRRFIRGLVIVPRGVDRPEAGASHASATARRAPMVRAAS
jgi:hypothetical protein